MISQKCPKCHSNRVRRGYRPTPLWSKILFRYNLLCDNCNWEFVGFAVPGTVTAKPNKRAKKNQTIEKSNNLNNNVVEIPVTNLQTEPVINLQTEPAENLVSLDNLAKSKTKARKKSQR
jgi:hypothetical protein